MEFDGLNLQDIERNKPVQVGWFTITEPMVRRQLYEYAAWFRDHELQPGRYPVMAARVMGCAAKHGELQLAIKVPSKIIDACLISGFGGVNYGPDTAGKAEIGREAEYVLCVGSALHYRKCLNPEAKHYYLTGEGQGELYYSRGTIYRLDGCTFEWLLEYETPMS